MFRTRHSIEALLQAKAARRRAARHRNPSLLEIVLGLAVFLALAAGVLSLATSLGG